MSEASSSEKLTYASYLQLNKILHAQDLESTKDGNTIHDEHLFIITHQAFELWFKQALVDIDSVCEIMKPGDRILVADNALRIIQRLKRVAMILKMVPQHFDILETMTAMDFMDFREYLKTGSGFESHQFRLLENRFGLLEEKRIQYNKETYKNSFDKKEELDHLEESQKDTLFLCIQKWLETMARDYTDQWKEYTEAVDRWINETCKDADENKEKKTSFNTVIDKKNHEDAIAKGERVFSHEATKAIIIINHHRHEPEFQHAHQILEVVLNIDEYMMRWRAIHISMVQRMIGNKPGTGGSSGHAYLSSTFCDQYKVFLDLYNIATFMIPSKYLTNK